MKKIILLLALCGLSTLSMTAQDDDLYFTPKKSHKAKAFDDNIPAYYVGSNRAVDEYNRRGKFRSSYQKIDGDSISDVIDLQAGDGLYPDSTYVDSDFAETLTKKRAQGYRYDDDDFEYTRRMSRWDGFCGPWYAGWHSPFWYGRYGYYDPWDPWYWDYAGWYSPWYCGWYSPWYYGSYYGGYWGGYWGWHGYYDPWYRPGWGGVAVVPGGSGRTIAGTRNHGSVTGRFNNASGSTRFGSRGNYGTSTSQSPARFGSRSYGNSDSNRSYSYGTTNNNNGFSNPTPSYGGSRSYGSGVSSSGFGGSRSGGGFSGGGHSGGGGSHFGGRR